MSKLTIPRSKLRFIAIFLLMLNGLMLNGCCAPSAPAKAPVTPEEHSVACPEQRPQVCTRDYRPVCATRDTGVRCVTTPCPSSEQLSYANACSACADAKVISYTQGACAEQAESKSY